MTDDEKQKLICDLAVAATDAVTAKLKEAGHMSGESGLDIANVYMAAAMKMMHSVIEIQCEMHIAEELHGPFAVHLINSMITMVTEATGGVAIFDDEEGTKH